MIFLNGVYDLLAALCGSGLFVWCIYPIFALAFLACVPRLIRSFFVR